MGNAPHTKYVVTDTVSERSEYPNLRRAPESVAVHGFAVYGKEEIELPEVSFLSRANGKLQKVFENLNRRQLERLKSERRRSESQRAKKPGK